MFPHHAGLANKEIPNSSWTDLPVPSAGSAPMVSSRGHEVLEPEVQV